jgi:hypothetical protein
VRHYPNGLESARLRDYPLPSHPRSEHLIHRMLRQAPATVGVPDVATIRARVLAEFEEYLDERLAGIRPGEGIAYFLAIEVVTLPLRSKQWSNAVKARDGNRCQRPHCTAVDNLHAHHIVPVSMDPDLANDLDNGLTLCPEHHAEAHAVVYGQPELAGVIRARKA